MYTPSDYIGFKVGGSGRPVRLLLVSESSTRLLHFQRYPAIPITDAKYVIMVVSCLRIDELLKLSVD